MNTQTLQDNRQKIFISDCEGPISKNDNAYELAVHFIPSGDKFFSLISKYDDVLADVVKKPGYRAGNTLKLIVPFLKAYGATEDKIWKYSAENILLVPGAKDTLQFVNTIMPSFIVSTSYKPYINALCHLTKFPQENTYCTELYIDKYEVTEKETEKLKKLRKEITNMSMIEIPKGADSLKDLPQGSRENVEKLNKIFWEKITKMDTGRAFQDVNPVGGGKKAEAVKDITGKLGGKIANVIYVGDSITDVEPMELVRENGGLAVSFNGNEYAIREAEIAILADNTIVTSILANTFNQFRREGVIQLANNWNRSGLKKHCADSRLVERVSELYPEKLPEVKIITDSNREELSEKSSDFRKSVRGEAIGNLG
ncbi:hypothetical protein AKJ58_00685 [candidate division MSBL1 archaeon SCGC-AAA385D11]|uniref:Haloacid dehalogenase-like hydrolase n=1 Tax=candidate division MSBL1 archaeon SCGC-AAA385D11 TaxID=1698286 RepID=A0A133VP66_9EURY|nr:hypothetical protein AKJ58_00685 [candidate division MSBL1 archaeon SCGC-AAA385D11]